MQPNLKSAIPLALAAATLALAVGGCGTTDRFASRSSDRYADRPVERSTVSGTVASSTPPSVDPFSPGYTPFPANANESAGIIGHSYFCEQHYDQLGCQTFDSAANERRFRYGPQSHRSDTRDPMASSDSRGTDSAGNRY